MQKPSIGRMVWVWLGENDDQENVLDDAQAFSGQIIYVNTDSTVDVMVSDHRGEIANFVGLTLRDPRPDEGHGLYEFTEASWMPYQKAQHDLNATKVGTPFDPSKDVVAPT